MEIQNAISPNIMNITASQILSALSLSAAFTIGTSADATEFKLKEKYGNAAYTSSVELEGVSPRTVSAKIFKANVVQESYTIRCDDSASLNKRISDETARLQKLSANIDQILADILNKKKSAAPNDFHLTESRLNAFKDAQNICSNSLK